MDQSVNYKHLPLKVQGFSQVLSLVCSVLRKLQVLIESLHIFGHASNFQSKMFEKLVPAVCSGLCKVFAWQNLRNI